MIKELMFQSPGYLGDFIKPRIITEQVLEDQGIEFDDLSLWYGDGSSALQQKVKLFKELSARWEMRVPDPTFFSRFWETGDINKIFRLWMDEDTSLERSIYLHIPFCLEKRCSYCMYHSQVMQSPGQLETYTNELVHWMEIFSPSFAGKPFHTVYVGGGTPSLLNKRQIERIFKAIETNYQNSVKGEHTFEASPVTINQKKLRILRQLGVNRISIGIQSLDRKVLLRESRTYVGARRINEIHQWVRAAGFEDFNIDLMIGLSGDDGSAVRRSLIIGIELGVPSITIYIRRSTQLTAAGSREYLNAGRLYTLIGELNRLAAEGGYRNLVDNPLYECQHYVRSDFTPVLPEYRTQYSPLHRNSCLGIGTGAQSFILDRYYYEIRSSAETGTPLYVVGVTSQKDRIRAFVAGTLYRYGYVELNEFKRQHGQDLTVIFSREIRELEQLGLASLDGNHLTLAEQKVAERDIAVKFFYRPSSLFDTLFSKLTMN